MELHASLGGGWGLGEVFADGFGIKERACVKESQMCCTEKGFDWRAEECLVHVLDPILDVCDCVDVVCLMWCQRH